MTNELRPMSNSLHSPDLAVEALKKARSRPAVLKLQIAKLRSAAPHVPIFAFEGDDDKIVYFHWISRIRPALKYAHFPCGGKGQVLRLRSSLKRDATGLSAGIYFFVDRDFDELRGQEPGPDIFMTDTYSVENYLVDLNVVDRILEIEFHCHGAPHVRERIREMFERAYGEFLSVTKEINRRIFIARKSKIEIKPLTDRVNDIADIDIDVVKSGRCAAEDIVVFLTDFDEQKSAQLLEEFDRLDPPQYIIGENMH